MTEILLLVFASIAVVLSAGYAAVTLAKYYHNTKVYIMRLIRSEYSMKLRTFLDRAFNATAVEKTKLLSTLQDLVKEKKVDLLFAGMLEERINTSLPISGKFYSGMDAESLIVLQKALKGVEESESEKIANVQRQIAEGNE